MVVQFLAAIEVPDVTPLVISDRVIAATPGRDRWRAIGLAGSFNCAVKLWPSTYSGTSMPARSPSVR